MPSNGGRSQGQSYALQNGGDFPFINLLKQAQVWTSGGAIFDPGSLDVNGYPTSLSATISTLISFVPTQEERPGNWTCTWDGQGTLTLPSGSLISGSLSNMSGGVGGFVFLPNASDNQFNINITATNASNPLTNLAVYHVDDTTAYLGGEIFGTLFKQKLKQGNFGAYRALDWFQTNNGNLATWANRKPSGYFAYYADEYRANLFAGTTSNVGAAYSVSAPSTWPGLVDKATVIVKWNATTTSFSPTLNVGSTGAVTISGPDGNTPLNTGHGQFVDIRPLINTYATLVYDADLNVWMKWGGDTSGSNGIQAGAPPEIFVQLCSEMGMHPWFPMPYMTVDPISDYPIQLATYVKNNGPGWMIPRFEGPNELWNFSTFGTNYANNKAVAHWGSSPTPPYHDAMYHDWYGKVMSVLGQAISTVYGADRTKYQVLLGVQTSFGTPTDQTASHDSRMTSAEYVAQAAAPQSPYTKTAASRWVTHICPANYMTPSEYDTNQETIDAFAYAVTNLGNLTAQGTISGSYAATLTTGSGSFNLTNLNGAYVNWKTWSSRFGSFGMSGYEGGYSPDDPSQNGVSDISGASKAAQCVLTLADYTGPSGTSNSGNPAVAGMTLSISGVGGMTQLNGNTYTVISVSGNSVTINVDSTGFSTYTSGGTATYVNSMAWAKTLRRASKAVASMRTYLTTNYNNFISAGGTFPSCYTLAGDSTWGVFDPDIYASPPSPQWQAIMDFNQVVQGVLMSQACL